MLSRIARWVLAPLALATAFTTVTAPPSGAITGPNIQKDFVHEYVGLVAFYDADGNFVQRCTGSLLSDEVFLTAGHCVTIDDATATLADSARIWFEQDAGVGYDPVTGTPAPSGYPDSGGVTSTKLYSFGFTGLTGSPESKDAALIVLDAGAVQAKYPDIDTYAQLPEIGAATRLGTGQQAVVTVTGYGVSRTNGKNRNNLISYRERLMGKTFVISNANQATAGYNLQLSSNFGQGRVGTCFGDSGGPALLGNTNVVLGVNSFVKNWSCAGQGFPYRVDRAPVQDWMQSVLGPQGLWDEVAPA
jgi:hypothetical protein